MHDNVSDSMYRINDSGYWVARTSLTVDCNVPAAPIGWKLALSALLYRAWCDGDHIDLPKCD
jgi:hypothetical protein